MHGFAARFWGLLLALASSFGCAASQTSTLEAELGVSGFETRVDGRGVTVLVSDVVFDTDRAALTPQGAKSVAQIAQLLKRFAAKRELICEGHTDGRGSEAYNFELSLRRARSVAASLAAAGVDAKRISSQGLGESRPLAAETKPDGGDSPEGRARNRRVELVIAHAQ